MMRLPLRLTTDITRARLARTFHLVPDAHSVQFIDAAEILHQDSSHPVSHEKIREVISSRSPAVWIGGSEPLHHPGVAHLVRAITGSGHYVFLETDGTLLRRRIHEFQPVPRLFLTVRLEPGAHLRAPKGLRVSASELAAEGIRAAQLSGFLLCVHARVQGDTELTEVAEVIQYAHSQEVDGIVITAANGGATSSTADAVAVLRKTAEARKLIGSTWWKWLSRLVEPVLSSRTYAARSVDDTGVSGEHEARANEEEVKVV